MVLVITLAVAAIWLLPIALSERIVFDGEAPEPFGALVSDRRFAVTAAATLFSEWVIWFRPAGPLGPVSQVLVLLRHTISYQTLTGWPVFAALCLLAGIGIGMLLRGIRLRRRKLFFRRARVSKRCVMTLLLLTAIAVLPLSLCFWFGADGAQRLSLQEVCRRERGVDEDLSFVTLKNDGAFVNAPKELYLTTDPDEPRQYRAVGLSVAPGGTETITENADTFLSVSRSGGDTVFLMDSLGNVLDSVELPELPPDTVYRRAGADWAAVVLRDSASQQVAAPVFSAQGGFYDGAFDLTLSAAPGTEIRYTLDGSVPDADAARYDGPIHIYDPSAEPNRWRSIQNVQEDYLDKDPVGQKPVDKGFVVRAVAVDAEGSCSAVVTQTYFINKGDYADDTVLSLVCDPDDLFGPDGIYVTGEAYDAWYAEKRAAEAADRSFEEKAPKPNYQLRGAQSERQADLEVFEDGAPVLNQAVGIRVQGNTARGNVLKRFSVYARAVYSGSGQLQPSPFLGKSTHSVMLRSGLDNAMSHAIAAGRDVAVLQTRPVRVFLNGEFWYDTYLQEKYSRTYFAQTFGVFKENVEYIAVGAWGNATEAERETIENILTQVEQSDLRDEENYERLCSEIDLQSYIDYCCIQAYLGNSDTTEKVNYCIWRTMLDEGSPYGDGRWRWALNDMDLHRSANVESSGVKTAAAVNPFTAKRNEDWQNPFSDGRMFRALLENETFRAQFARTFMDLANTTFAEARTGQILADFGKMPDYADGFFQDRTGYMIGFVSEVLGIADQTATLTLGVDEPDAGTVALNTITPDLASGSWSGRYYTAVPVTLTAQPAAGRMFDHWEVDGETVSTQTLTLTLKEGGTTVHAIFR